MRCLKVTSADSADYGLCKQIVSRYGDVLRCQARRRARFAQPLRRKGRHTVLPGVYMQTPSATDHPLVDAARRAAWRLKPFAAPARMGRQRLAASVLLSVTDYNNPIAERQRSGAK